MTDPVRSLTSGFTPLSITATVTPAPSVSSQADSTFIMSRTHCWLSLMVSAEAAGGAATDTAPPRAAQHSTAAAAFSRDAGRQGLSIRVIRGRAAGGGRGGGGCG